MDNESPANTVATAFSRDPIGSLVLVAVLAIALFVGFRNSAPAPAPVPVVPAPAPYVPPAPAPAPVSPCGPNRCPYRQTAPFTVTCPWCRNYITAIPPADTGQRGVVSKYIAPPNATKGAAAN